MVNIVYLKRTLLNVAVSVVKLAENYTEELLEVHEQELEKMRSYFEMHKDILELIAKRERLWEEMLEFEVFAVFCLSLFSCHHNLFSKRTPRNFVHGQPVVQENVLRFL